MDLYQEREQTCSSSARRPAPRAEPVALPQASFPLRRPWNGMLPSAERGWAVPFAECTAGGGLTDCVTPTALVPLRGGRLRNGGGLDSARLASMSRTPPTSRGGASSLSLLTRPGRVGVAFQRFTNRERFCSVPGPCIDSCRDLARHARPAPPRPARPAPFRPVFMRPPRQITSQRTPAFRRTVDGAASGCQRQGLGSQRQGLGETHVSRRTSVFLREPRGGSCARRTAGVPTPASPLTPRGGRPAADHHRVAQRNSVFRGRSSHPRCY